MSEAKTTGEDRKNGNAIETINCHALDEPGQIMLCKADAYLSQGKQGIR